jgi:hypothetical protein
MPPPCARKVARTVAALALILGTTRPATAQQQYDYTRISDSSTPNFRFFDGQPAINASGTVSFQVDFATSGGGIFRGNGGALTTIATTSEGFTSFGTFASPTINDAGAVAFLGQSSSTRSGIYVRGTASPFTPANPDDTHYNGGFNDGPAINNVNQVAFRANIGSSFGGGQGVFRYDNASTTTQITRSGLESNFSTFLGDPAINSSGTVLFKATLVSGGNGLFLGSGGAITTIASFPSVSAGEIGGWSAINDSGVVAYLVIQSGSTTVYRYADGTSTPVVASGGVFTNVSNPSINSSGKIAFVGNLAAGGQGIFTGPDAVLDKVIQTGDPLFGSTVTGLAIGPRAFNAAGQLAFYATLADGREGVFVATPVPEPGGALGVAVLLFGIRNLRRRVTV